MKEGRIDMRRDDGEERERRVMRREAAEGLRRALIEYVGACRENQPELLAAIEVLSKDLQRLEG